MKTRFCRAVGLACTWVLGAGWLATAVAYSQNDNWHGPVEQVSAVEDSSAQGAAFASDSDEYSGTAFAVDPSWIRREPGALPQAGSQPGRVRAIEIAAQRDRNAPPVPMPDDEPVARPAPSPRAESSDNHGNNSHSNDDGSTSQSGDNHCDQCNKSCDQCDSCCDDCCDKCGHHRHCHGLFDCCDCCPLYCCDEDPGRLFDCCCMQQNDVALYGWLDGGIMGNGLAPTSHFNGPVTFPDRDDGQLNQFYGVLERTADCNNCGWYVGGRVDMYWGSDFIYTTAAGLDGQPNGNSPRWQSTDSFLYGWSMPQLYAEVDYNDVQFKLGHFYSPIGYEVAPAVGNFFYTHSYSRQYGEPFTHTGVLASQPMNENWKWYAGIDNGWNAFNCNSRANFLGGLSYCDDCWGSLSFMIQTGGESDRNFPGMGPFSNRTVYSLVWQRDFTSRFQYVLEHNLGVQADTLGFNANDRRRADWYGISQYLFYRINCCWSLGWRFEWFDDPQGYVVTGVRPATPTNSSAFPAASMKRRWA